MMKSKAVKQSGKDRSALDAAHKKIAEAMVQAVGLWFVPYASGIACNFTEKTLITSVLRELGCEWNPRETDAVFWFVRKKMLLLNVGTYVPYAGTALQVIEVYSMGQFAIRCAVDLQNLSESAMCAAWGSIEIEMLSGKNLVEFYEGFSGKRFPDQIREPFQASVDRISSAYRCLMKVPGLQKFQDGAGEAVRQTIAFSTRGWKKKPL